MKKTLFFSRGLKKPLQNTSSVALGWFVLETADRKAKTTSAKGNLSSKPSAQHSASMAKIFSRPLQIHSVSLVMSQLEVVYATERHGSQAASCGEQWQPELQYLCCSHVFPKLLHFWTIWEVLATFSLVLE